MKTVSSSEMQLIDKIAQERFKIPSLILMENAGKVSAAVAMNILNIKELKKKMVAVFCGKGNNGGDGLVVSRYLLENKVDTTTYLLCSRDKLKDDPRINFKLLKDLNSRIIILKDKKNLSSIRNLSNYDLIIDAIFGTGFKGRPDNFISGIINSINKCRVRVLSIDIPSGLDATTGECKGPCIKATKTVTFGLPKSGFYQLDGPRFTGKVVVKNIGFPESLLKSGPSI